jgi:hypothetical protein
MEVKAARVGEGGVMDSREKRELREQKRVIKRLGNQRQRRQVRQALAHAPEEAAEIETDYGKYRSADLNGIDRDQTRRRAEKAGTDKGQAEGE